MEEVKKAVETLAKAAAKASATSALDAMQLSQAALNLAHAVEKLTHL